MHESKQSVNLIFTLFSDKLVTFSYLDLIFHFSSKVANDECRLHDCCGDKIFVSLVLLLKLGQ